MKTRWFVLIPVLAAVLTLALFEASCGSDNDNNGSKTPVPTHRTTTPATKASTGSQTPGATSMGTSSGAGTQIDGTVTDTPFSVTVNPTSAPAGEVTFNVKNTGTMDHSFYVIKSDLAAGDLPVDAATFMVDESQVDIVKEIESDELHAGDSAKLTADLQAGHYVLICNVASHYESGMRTDFTVQ